MGASNRSTSGKSSPIRNYLPTESVKSRLESGCDVEKLDVFIFGCFLYEIATLRFPLKGKFSRMPRQYSSSLVEFVKLLMCDDEALRPTFADLMELREELLAAPLAYEPTTRDFSFHS